MKQKTGGKLGGQKQRSGGTGAHASAVPRQTFLTLLCQSRPQSLEIVLQKTVGFERACKSSAAIRIWRRREGAKAARAARLPRMAARCGATSAATCPAGFSPPARSARACGVHATLFLTVDAHDRIKDERTKKEIDSICARHERAEIIRRKRDAPMLQSLGSQPPPWKPIAPTAVFGGPVRGFTFSRVCNLRASTPGLSTRAVARPGAHTGPARAAARCGRLRDTPTHRQCLCADNVRMLAPVVSLL